ncbi:MAG: LysE family translocator [Marinibacterium sp.]
MIDVATLLVFAPVALALALVPGPNMAFCVARSIDGGRRAGLLAALGLVPGPFFGMAAAVAGIDALADTAPQTLSVLRWAGAGYLLWLAWRALGQADRPRRDGSDLNVLGGGVLVSLTNPKGAAFAFAVAPQFIDPANPILPQALVLGGVLAGADLMVNAALVLLSTHLVAGRPAIPGYTVIARRLAAGVYGGLALRMILTERT